MLWGDSEAAVAMPEAGDRMWVNTLTLTAISKLASSPSALAADDPLVGASLAELHEDAMLLFKYNHDPQNPVQAVTDLMHRPGQYSLDDALKQIPVSDFRAWAAGLVKLSQVYATRGLRSEDQAQDSALDDAFRAAMDESPNPGDKALGTTNYLFAKYLAAWHRAQPV